MLTPCISLVEECVMITLSSPGHYCWTVWLDLMSRINKENCVSKPNKRKVLSLTSSRKLCKLYKTLNPKPRQNQENAKLAKGLQAKDRICAVAVSCWQRKDFWKGF